MSTNKRNRTVITNKDLSNSILRLEGRQDRQDEAMKRLQEEVAPLHSMMTKVSASMDVVKWLVSAMGLASTALEAYRAFAHR